MEVASCTWTWTKALLSLWPAPSLAYLPFFPFYLSHVILCLTLVAESLSNRPLLSLLSFLRFV